MSAQLAIIGSAGRKDDAAKLTLPLWNDTKRLIARFVKEREIKSVISGGSAGMDHLAVGLFNAKLITSLTIAFPAYYEWHTGRYCDNGARDSVDNPGATLNRLHEAFGAIIGRDTLGEIKTALYSGAAEIIADSFMERNGIVASDADAVIAFTFGAGPRLKAGGSASTARKYLARGGKALYHVDLHTMTLYETGVTT